MSSIMCVDIKMPCDKYLSSEQWKDNTIKTLLLLLVIHTLPAYPIEIQFPLNLFPWC